MDPERQRRVDELFDRALEKEPTEVAAFLKAECPEEPTVWAEVLSLLAHHAAAEQAGLLAKPAWDPLANLPSDASVAAALPSPHAPAGYVILGELGRGGMGIVYKAWQTVLNRFVALKMIRSGADATPAELARFRVEARAVARLQHPNLVQIYEVGQQEGRPFVALEYLAGGSLAQKLGEAPLPPVPAAELVQTLSLAVHYAHQQGVLHRDLKPANILLAGDGTPKIADFGLAKRLESEPGLTAPEYHTESGAVMGTPSYMAPEQARGKTGAIDPRTDVYALGAILYETLTGRPPFQGTSRTETLLLVLGQEPVPPRQLQPKVPRDLDTICLKCLRKEPARRYGSAEALANDLKHFLAGEPIGARPSGLWERGFKWARRRPATAALLGVFVLALLGLIGAAIWNHRQVQVARAATLVQGLAAARTTAVPLILKDLAPYRRWAIPLLEQWLDTAPPDSQQQLNVWLALLPDRPSLADNLFERLLAAKDLADVPVFRDALADHRQRLAPMLWTVLEGPAQGADQRRFRAALALAAYVPADSEPARTRWQPHAPFLIKQVLAAVSANPSHYPLLLEAFQPIRDVLHEPLGQTIRDVKQPDAERQSATNLLKDFLRGTEPPPIEFLAELIVATDPRQYEKLWELVEFHRDSIVHVLKRKLDQTPWPRWPDEPLNPGWLSPQPSLVQALAHAQGILADRFAFCQTMPLDQFISAAEMLERAGYRPTRLRPYSDGKLIRVAAIWTRDGRHWQMVFGKSAEEIRTEDATCQKRGYRPVDVAGYAMNSGPGRQEVLYAALWYETNTEDEDAAMYVGVPYGAPHQAASRKLTYKGFNRWTQQVVADKDGQLRISSVWRKTALRTPAFSMDKLESLWAQLQSPDLFLGDVSVCKGVAPLPRPQADMVGPAKLPQQQALTRGSWSYSGLWHSNPVGPPPWETILLTGMDPVGHRDCCLGLIDQGFRPTALSVAQGAEREPSVVAAVWHRPFASDEAKDAWAKRQANVAVTLWRLNNPNPVWPLLRQSTEQHRRTYLIHRLIPLGLDPGVLAARLMDPATDVSERRALVLSLGELSASELSPPLWSALGPRLLTSYRDDGDPGYHSAVAWLLRRWGKKAELRKADATLVSKGPVSGRRWYVNGQGQVMAVVAGPAWCWMGSSIHEADREPVEILHCERIAQPFAIGVTEVTNAQWQRFLWERRRVKFQPNKYSETSDEPAILLTWDDAVDYCQWLNRQEGLSDRTGYRLPSEAEWEFACKAGTTTSRHYGSSEEMLTNYAWYRGTIDHRGNTEKHVREVGLLKPNDWGLFDLYGNAWEWCQDQDREGQATALTDPPKRALRGGAFDSRPENLRSAARYSAPQNRPIHMAGLRVARTLPDDSKAANGR
jgi:formylglycine-generating enzyme required for sulfatase activity